MLYIMKNATGMEGDIHIHINFIIFDSYINTNIPRTISIAIGTTTAASLTNNLSRSLAVNHSFQWPLEYLLCDTFRRARDWAIWAAIISKMAEPKGMLSDTIIQAMLSSWTRQRCWRNAAAAR